jgi:hypothetical protein
MSEDVTRLFVTIVCRQSPRKIQMDLHHIGSKTISLPQRDGRSFRISGFVQGITPIVPCLPIGRKSRDHALIGRCCLDRLAKARMGPTRNARQPWICGAVRYLDRPTQALSAHQSSGKIETRRGIFGPTCPCVFKKLDRTGEVAVSQGEQARQRQEVRLLRFCHKTTLGLRPRASKVALA